MSEMKSYVFVGAPQYGTVYSETVSSDLLRDQSMASYIKTMSYTVGGADPGVRTIHAVYPEEISFAKACQKFGEMMELYADMKKVYAFVGDLESDMICSETVVGAEPDIEFAIDEMVCRISGGDSTVWMTAALDVYSFAQASADFDEYMRSKLRKDG